MLQVQKIYSSHRLLPSPEVRIWYPRQDFIFCQIQSPPHPSPGQQLVQPSDHIHWPPVAHEASPHCLQMESVCSTLLCWLSSWGVHGGLSELDRSHHPNCQQLPECRQEKEGISKERGGLSQHSQIPSTLLGEAYPCLYDYTCSS